MYIQYIMQGFQNGSASIMAVYVEILKKKRHKNQASFLDKVVR